MTQLTRAGLPLLIALYPLAVYFGIQTLSVRALTLLLAAVGLLHLYRALTGARSSWLWVLVCLLLGGWSWLQESSLGIKFYPVAINLSLLLVFGWSLIHPPTVIERIARLREPDLPDAALPYIRKVTLVWCLFFMVNAAVSSWTVFASDAIWALYNGLLSYLLIGLLLGGEWLLRQRIRSQLHD